MRFNNWYEKRDKRDRVFQKLDNVKALNVKPESIECHS